MVQPSQFQPEDLELVEEALSYYRRFFLAAVMDAHIKGERDIKAEDKDLCILELMDRIIEMKKGNAA